MKKVRVDKFFFLTRARELYNGRDYDYTILSDNQIDKIIEQNDFIIKKNIYFNFDEEREYIISILKSIKRDRKIEIILK